MKSSFLQPAEWAEHQAVWLALPSHEELWEERLPDAQKEFTALCRSIAADGGERIHLLVRRPADRIVAEKALAGTPVSFFEIPYGDIWLRDTAPLFVWDLSGRTVPTAFRFNGWGEKYLLPGDADVSRAIAVKFPEPLFQDWVLEGGSIEIDGEGTGLTTEQCLLNPNRNPGLNRQQIELKLKESLGIEKLLWLRDGLLNDHTDGHIDTLSRFVAPGKVLTMSPAGMSDPNREVLLEIENALREMTDHAGRRLDVVTVSSPGEILSDEGELMPASYANFYIGNKTVVVPTYGSANDEEAVKRIGSLFPGRNTVGCSARAILEGGGAFHCITQQQPRDKKGL
jgi:agmatine deiminase